MIIDYWVLGGPVASNSEKTAESIQFLFFFNIFTVHALHSACRLSAHSRYGYPVPRVPARGSGQRSLWDSSAGGGQPWGDRIPEVLVLRVAPLINELVFCIERQHGEQDGCSGAEATDRQLRGEEGASDHLLRAPRSR